MRPGQETPDEARYSSPQRPPCTTSMRPGQETPDEGGGATAVVAGVDYFNEAGARNPG